MIRMRPILSVLSMLLCPVIAPLLCGEAPQARRLTHNQYNNTVRDLVGDHTRPADQFPPEDFVNGFKNQISAQDIPPLLAQVYANAAERLARTAFLAGPDDNNLIPSPPQPAPDSHSP